MRWLKKVLIATLASLTLAGAIPSFSSVQAAPPGQSQARVRYYYVYYRSCPCSRWALYSYHRNYFQAVAVAVWIRSFGYETFIR